MVGWLDSADMLKFQILILAGAVTVFIRIRILAAHLDLLHNFAVVTFAVHLLMLLQVSGTVREQISLVGLHIPRRDKGDIRVGLVDLFLCRDSPKAILGILVASQSLSAIVFVLHRLVASPGLWDVLGLKLLARLVAHLVVLAIFGKNDLAGQRIRSRVVVFIHVEHDRIALAVDGRDHMVTVNLLNRDVVFHDIQIDVVEFQALVGKVNVVFLVGLLDLIFSEFCKVFL